MIHTGSVGKVAGGGTPHNEASHMSNSRATITRFVHFLFVWVCAL